MRPWRSDPLQHDLIFRVQAGPQSAKLHLVLLDIGLHIFQMIGDHLRIDSGDDIALFDEGAVVDQVEQSHSTTGVGRLHHGADQS